MTLRMIEHLQQIPDNAAARELNRLTREHAQHLAQLKANAELARANTRNLILETNPISRTHSIRLRAEPWVYGCFDGNPHSQQGIGVVAMRDM